MPLYIPENYTNILGTVQNTEKAVKSVKDMFQDNLSAQLALLRVTAPMVVLSGTGINDDLNSVERPVRFPVKDLGDRPAEVVHSLAKWKRQALGEYGFQPDTGLWTDMNAIRRDEEPDALHSIYVDQWDWEKVITADMRTVDELKRTVTDIVDAICSTLSAVKCMYPQIQVHLNREVSFVTAQELEDLYPDFTGKERENAYVKDHPTTFIIGIGGKLNSGKPHDGRAPDYDDWNLNGDLMFWDETLQQAVELSSMGIRVDADAMRKQCAELGCENRLALPFHQGVLTGRLPLSMGGGIGQSRLCMLLLGKAHIGEVQVSLWPKEMREECAKKNIMLL